MATRPLTLPMGEYLPDLPDYNNPGSDTVLNVVPKTPTSYGPVQAPVVYSDALDDRCQGAAAFIDTDGNVSMFAGDAHKLYQLSSGGTTWTDVSGVSYSTPSDGQWKFEYYNGFVTATNYIDPIQVFQLGVSLTFSDLAAAAPTAKYMAFVKGFLAVAFTNDPSSNVQPQRVWWPGVNDPTNWPTPGGTSAAQVQSSYNDIFGSQGSITGIVGNLGNADAAVFFQHAVWRMIYSGPPQVFDFFPAEGVRGCPAPNSIVQYSNLCYYLGEDGFYVFDGMSSKPIGANKVDNTFYNDLDQAYFDRIIGAVDPINKQILWAYPGDGNSGGNPNKILIYNWQLDKWSLITLITGEVFARLMTIGYTLDELYTVLGYLIDDVPASLDSPLWTGGKVQLGMFDTNHKLNFFTGQNLAATVDTSESQLFNGKKARIKNARPIVDGPVTPSVTIGYRDLQTQDVNYTSAIPMNALGTSPVRTSGRYIRGRITLPANSDFNNITGLELEATEAGIR